MLDRCLRWFINVWLGLILVLELIRAADIGFRGEPSIWTGIWQSIDALMDAFNPLNIMHFVAMLIVASPAFGAFIWLERRERARQAKVVAAASAARAAAM
jgi:hypothetical protein